VFRPNLFIGLHIVRNSSHYSSYTQMMFPSEHCVIRAPLKTIFKTQNATQISNQAGKTIYPMERECVSTYWPFSKNLYTLLFLLILFYAWIGLIHIFVKYMHNALYWIQQVLVCMPHLIGYPFNYMPDRMFLRFSWSLKRCATRQIARPLYIHILWQHPRSQIPNTTLIEWRTVST